MENIITLAGGAYSAKINLSRGANCISFRNSGYNAKILREPNYLVKPDNPYLYGMPILYPVNRIENGSFIFENRRYSFPINEPKTNCHIHGFVHEAQFNAVQVSESSISCRYEGQYADCMQKFRIELYYETSDKGLFQKTTITNLSDKNMPNFLGFHTTFNVPFVNNSNAKNIRVFVNNELEVQRNVNTYLPNGNFPNPDEVTQKLRSGSFVSYGNPISRHYKSGKSGLMEIYDVENKLKIVYENDKKLGWRLIYNGDGEDYICLEPQTCMVNCQNSEFDRKFTGFDYIEPGLSREYISRIYISKMNYRESDL